MAKASNNPYPMMPHQGYSQSSPITTISCMIDTSVYEMLSIYLSIWLIFPLKWDSRDKASNTYIHEYSFASFPEPLREMGLTLTVTLLEGKSSTITSDFHIRASHHSHNNRSLPLPPPDPISGADVVTSHQGYVSLHEFIAAFHSTLLSTSILPLL